MAKTAQYRFRSWSLTTDDTGNGNTIINNTWTASNITAGGGITFAKASSQSAQIPINFTSAAIPAMMGVLRWNGSPASFDTAYGLRNTSWWDSDRNLAWTGSAYLQTRYDSGGSDINNIPYVVDKPLCFAYNETWSWWEYYLENGWVLTKETARSYSNLWNLMIWCRNNNGTNERYANVSFANLQTFNSTVSAAQYKNFLAYTRWFF